MRQPQRDFSCNLRNARSYEDEPLCDPCIRALRIRVRRRVPLPAAGERSIPAPIANAVRIKISTSQGDIVAVLDAKRAPKTVANFLQYVDAAFLRRRDVLSRGSDLPSFQGGNHDREKPSDPQLVLEPTSKTGILNKDGYLRWRELRTPTPPPPSSSSATGINPNWTPRRPPPATPLSAMSFPAWTSSQDRAPPAEKSTLDDAT